MWTIFQMLIEWTVVRYVQSFDKLYSQIRKHHIRNLKFQLEQIKFKRYKYLLSPMSRYQIVTVARYQVGCLHLG